MPEAVPRQGQGLSMKKKMKKKTIKVGATTGYEKEDDQ
jgi:hypothetical protein